MVISCDGQQDSRVPIDDLAVLLIEHAQVTMTHTLLAALTEGKVATVVCGSAHMPAGVLLPFAANTMAGERTRLQLACGRSLEKRLWQAVVVCKLRRQGELLERTTGGDAGLSALARRVRSGDPENIEAQGAQRYWPRLLGATFRRARDGEQPNNLLNYGYAILRAATARALAGAGLLAGIGLFHGRRSDSFPLASDMMEPFRPLVDGVVWELWQSRQANGELNRTAKTRLLAVLNLGVTVGGCNGAGVPWLAAHGNLTGGKLRGTRGAA
jgi:CRISPR-associated protein Cas1